MAKRKSKLDQDDVPELGPDFFARAKRGIDHLPAGMVADLRRGRGKQKAPTKELISLRLDRETLDAFRKTGRGWQGRMNETLGRAAKRMRA